MSSTANNFDPLKQSSNTLTRGSNSQTEINNVRNNGNQHRPAYNSVWKRQTSTSSNNVMYTPTEQPLKSTSTRKLHFFHSFHESLNQQPSYEFNSQNSFPPAQTRGQLHQRFFSCSEQGLAHHYQQGTPLSHEHHSHSLETCNEHPWEGYSGDNYIPEETSTYYQSENHHHHQKGSKRRAFSSKIDRLVQRVPALGKFYKQPSLSLERTDSNHQFQTIQSSNPTELKSYERELTANELALTQRYTDPTRMKAINLPSKEQTQPVDLRIHHETNQIYACDIGRSLVEIFNIDGTFQHVIEDSTMTKFQPTALAVASDGTIILASHFHHRLHMYSPSDLQNPSNRYVYKLFKLGTTGDQVHQFYHPAGIVLDPKNGNLYVCDRGNFRIQVMRPEGVCERVIELFSAGKKKTPLDATRVALQPNLNQIVCIVGNGDALCFLPKQANGRMYVEPFHIVDENGLGIEGASGLAVDTCDRIFISDTGHHRIVICTPEGGYITSFGREGTELGQLKRPCGLDITTDGVLVVTDPGNRRLQFFGTTHEENVLSQKNSAPVEHDFVANL